MFGDFPETSVFPKRRHEKVLTKEEVLSTSKWALHQIMGSTPFDTPPHVQAELRALTKDELDRGECRGPFTKEQLDALFPGGWLPGVRFPVCQKDKVRGCDHYSKHGQNGTGSTSETVDTEGHDSILAVAKLWASSVDADRNVRIKLSDGSVLEGVLHESLDLSDLRVLLARLIDLARAYKQLARRPEDADLAIFAQLSETGIWEFYMALVLGFGARDAVFSFNLMARALRHILNVVLWVPATHFYDDFSQVDVGKFAANSCSTTQRLFDLLGWEYKSKPDQLLPPSASFSPLGVNLDFSEEGFAIVANTANRRARIQEDIGKLCDLEVIPSNSVQSLAGICTYADAQTSGRIGATILKEVRNAAKVGGSDGRSRLLSSLRNLAAYFHAVKPRRLRISAALPPIFVLTDAASETAGASVGAVLVDPVNSIFEYFGKKLATGLTDKWRLTGKDQIICQAELLAIPIAFTTWANVLADRDILVFIDNDPAREALIRGSSISEDSARYVDGCRLLCAANGTAPWYARVASPSNLADLPSRGDFRLLDASGATRVEPVGVACEPSLAFVDF